MCNAQARIGETEAEITKRYGKSVVTFSKGDAPLEKGYLSGGFRISVTYLDGVSQAEFFSKPDSSKLSEEEIDVLLSVNAIDGKEWKEERAPVAMLRTWKLEESDRIANYTVRENMLMIQTRSWMDLEQARRASDEKAKLKNF